MTSQFSRNFPQFPAIFPQFSRNFPATFPQFFAIGFDPPPPPPDRNPPPCAMRAMHRAIRRAYAGTPQAH